MWDIMKSSEQLASKTPVLLGAVEFFSKTLSHWFCNFKSITVSCLQNYLLFFKESRTKSWMLQKCFIFQTWWFLLSVPTSLSKIKGNITRGCSVPLPISFFIRANQKKIMASFLLSRVLSSSTWVYLATYCEHTWYDLISTMTTYPWEADSCKRNSFRFGFLRKVAKTSFYREKSPLNGLHRSCVF